MFCLSTWELMIHLIQHEKSLPFSLLLLSALLRLHGQLMSAVHVLSLGNPSSQAAHDFGNLTEESRMSYVT